MSNPSSPVSNLKSLLRYSFVAQILFFMTIPIFLFLGKYSSAGYGVFTIGFAVASIIGAVSALRVERAIVVEDHDVLRSILIHCGYYILACSIACFFIAYGALQACNVTRVQILILSIFASVYAMIFGVTQVLIHLAIRVQKVRLTGMSDLIFSIVVVVLLLALPAKINHEAITVFIAFTVARLASILPYYRIDYSQFSSSQSANWITFGALRKYYVPVFTVLLSNIQLRGLFYLTGVAYGESTTGNLSLTQKIVYAPVNLIGASLRKSFFLEFTQSDNDFKTVIHYIGKILLIGSIASLLFFPIFVIIFKHSVAYLPPTWNLVPNFAIVLYPAASILCLLAWLDRIYDAKKKQPLALYYEIAYTASLYAFIFLALYLKVDSINLMLVFSTVTVMYNCIWAFLTLRLIDSPLKPAIILTSIHIPLLIAAIIYAK